MDIPVISFIPPIVGTEGDFNTFRLGLALTKRLSIGQEVFLMNQKTMTVYGLAKVQSIATGVLMELCETHGAGNHTQIGLPAAGAGERLLSVIQKIYGPHIAKVNKKATVVELRRIYDETESVGHDAIWQAQGKQN